MQSDCVQRVIDVFIRSKKLSPGQVTIDSEFAALEIDSMDAVVILFELEKEFDITIPDEQMHSVRTVRQAVEAVQSLLNPKPSSIAVS